MQKDKEIFVPYLAHKLKILFEHAPKKNGQEPPRNKSQLGKRLIAELGEERDWNKTFNKVASQNILADEKREGKGFADEANANGPKLTESDHSAILKVFGLIWPHETYWDPAGRADISLAKFKRSLLTDKEKITLTPMRRNRVYARDELFTLEVEDISDTKNYTGCITVNPLDHRVRAELSVSHNDEPDVLSVKLRGKIVGTIGFPDFHLHVEGDEASILKARSGSRKVESNGQIVEVHLRREHDSPAWFVRPSSDESVVVSGRFSAAEFDVEKISKASIIHVYATCEKPLFCVSKSLALSEEDEAANDISLSKNCRCQNGRYF